MITAVISGKAPDGSICLVPVTMEALPQVGNWIEVASFLPHDERARYQEQKKIEDYNDITVDEVEHNFVEVKRVVWVEDDSYLLPDMPSLSAGLLIPIITIQPIKV
jgi:hypothetical protein